MKKSLLIAALAVFTMASCSKDEVIDVKQDAISFNVVAENTTKAAELFCSYNYMNSFKVYADFNTPTADPTVAKYIDGDQINVAANGTCSTPVTRYWPELDGGKSLTFYAIAGTATSIDNSRTAGSVPTLTDYTVSNTNVGEHEDLLYSVNAENTNKNAAVHLNFRHALSLIQFTAKNTNTKLHVVIEDVMVGNVASAGKFSFPATTTGTSAFEEHADDSGDDYAGNDSDINCWSNQGTNINYTIAAGATTPAEWSEKVITGDGTVVNLTYVASHTGSTDFETAFNRSMLLIPQVTTANTATSGSFNGSYLAVNCRIYNIAGTSYDLATDVLLHEGWAIIPVAFDWKPGNKYVYTFVFGEGNGGTDGGNDLDPKPGTDPVLFPISYTLTIDDFDFISDANIDMKQE